MNKTIIGKISGLLALTTNYLYQSIFSLRLSRIYITAFVLLFGVGAEAFAQANNYIFNWQSESAHTTGLTSLSNTSPQTNEKIAFEVAPSNIYTMNSDGTMRTQVTSYGSDHNAYTPSWSPDGSKIAFGCDAGICIINVNGTGLIAIPNTLNDDDNPTWSPDGNRIAFVRNYNRSNEGIFIVNANGSNLIQLTTGLDDYPDWFPDGTRLLFSRYTTESSTSALFTISVSGGSPSLLLGGGDYFDPKLSSDGSKIVFAGNRNNIENIYTVNANGSGVTQITNNGPNDISTKPTWSPDNSKIAYSFYTTGVNEDDIYVMNANGTNKINITNTPNIEEDAPSWQPSTNAAVNITVQTNPAERSFTVDGVTYNSTQTFNWQSGAAHTIGTNSPQTGSTGTQYIWSNWSDGGAISHTVSPTANTTYTANFNDSLPQCIRPSNLGLDFGDVLFGTSQEKTFTYTNNSLSSFTPQNYTLEGAADYCITNNTCENTLLAPGQSCTWTAKFTARAGGLRINEEFNLFTKQGLSNGSDCKGLVGKGKLNPDQIDPRLYQIDYPSIPYGYCTTLGQTPPYSIKNKGCALTSLANAINYILKSAPAPSILQTPPSLQDFIRSIDAYSHQTGSYCISGPGNDVNFPKAVNNYPLTTASAEKALVWRSVSVKNDPAALIQVLKEGYPVVVGIIQNVKKKKLPAKCDVAQPPADCFGNAHYVLAVGEDLQIIDPERSANYSFQDLINYRATKGKTVVGWQTIGQVRVKDGAYDLPKQPRNCFSATLSSALCSEDSSTIDGTSSNNITQTTNSVSADASDLSVVAGNNVSFQLVDPQGRKTGYNSSTGQIEKAIPESDYYSENIIGADEVETDNGSTTGTVSHPVNGTYQVIIKGDQTGNYLITINRSNRYAQSISPIELNGTIQIGETKTFTFNYSFSKNPVDFDNDGNSDVSVFRPSNGVWYLNQSQNGFTGVQFGVSTDKLVPADYDGDGKTDIAVYRSGTWYLNRSQTGFTGIAFGDGNDIPQPADFDGDGKAEIAVWRPSNGTWYVLNLATNQFNAYQFGASTDKPVVGDYDGDGKADYAVYRPSNGTWYLQRSTAGFTGMQFGDTNDKPVAADYDGDGKTDVAVFRPSNGTWYLQRSQAGFTGVQFGISTDLPTPADYDGDGKADIAVFRSGTWYLNRSTAGFTGIAFGASTDKPVPNAFVP